MNFLLIKESTDFEFSHNKKINFENIIFLSVNKEPGTTRVNPSVVQWHTWIDQSHNTPGGRLNKKDGLTRYGNSHVKDKTS